MSTSYFLLCCNYNVDLLGQKIYTRLDIMYEQEVVMVFGLVVQKRCFVHLFALHSYCNLAWIYWK